MKQGGTQVPIVSLCGPVRSTGLVKAINKRCSKDLQAAADGYCKFWVKPPSNISHGVNPIKILKKSDRF
jgi:hypothetical protein